jgi:UDP-N-acetylmuramoyl-tripeptide--D-alanyl-D-alanine ligase
MMQGVATDTRENMRGKLFVALRGDKFDAHAFLADAAAQGAAAAMVDRRAGAFARPAGLPLIEVGDTRIALGDLGRWWRGRLRSKVVVITGSSGKTTTRRLVDAALASTMKGSASPKSFNNDIGVPLTLLAAGSTDGYLVVEVGMNHPGEISPLARMAAPNVAIVTMAGRAHLGGMGSVEAIIDEKATIVDGLGSMGIAIVNGDQPALVAAIETRVKPGVRVVTFGMGEPCMWRMVSRVAAGGGQSMRVREPSGEEWTCSIGLPGDYNAMNALAAIACARMLEVPAEKIAGALVAVTPTEMRMTRQEIGGIAVYNDAYNANPDAMLASLRGFRELSEGASRRVTVLGDMLELGDQSAELHAEVGRAAVAAGARLAVFVGEASAYAADAARQMVGVGVEVIHVAALDAPGVAEIAAALRPGDVILLKGSRGSRMERLVEALSARAAGGTAVPAR